MALRIDSFEVDVTVRRRRPTGRGRSSDRAGAGMPLGPSAADCNVPSTDGDSRVSGSTVASGKLPIADKVFARAASPTTLTPTVPAPAPIVTDGMPRFISPPIHAPAPKPLPASPISTPEPQPTRRETSTAAAEPKAETFVPMFKRLSRGTRPRLEPSSVGLNMLPSVGSFAPTSPTTRQPTATEIAPRLAAAGSGRPLDEPTRRQM